MISDTVALKALFSDDPQFIVYSQITLTGPQIFVLQKSEAAEQIYQLTDAAGFALAPRWSPDVQYIAFNLYDPESEQNDLWLIENITADVWPVTEGGASDSLDFSWSPDSEYIVYTAPQSNGAERDIHRVEIENGEIINLTSDSPVWDSAPTWSPEGSLIAFVSDRHEQGKLTDNIWVMAPDGSDPRKITDEEEWEDVFPSWSPDGQEIAFYRWSILPSDDGGPSGLWVTDLEGNTRLISLLEGIFSTFDPPRWSPDGRYIAYQQGDPDNADIYVVSAEGGDPVNVSAVNVSDMDGHDAHASWSTDSTLLIFTNSTESTVRLFIVQPDGSNRQPLLEEDGNLYGEWMPVSP